MRSCDFGTCKFSWEIEHNFLLVSHFFYCSIFLQLNCTAKRDTAASVICPGSPTKKHLSPSGDKAASAFSCAKFGWKTADGSRSAHLKKEGKYAVQVLYPEKTFALGAK
jgi:hypothetical protein